MKKVNRHVLGRGIGIEFVDAMRLGRTNRVQAVLILLPEDKGVISVLVDPAVDPLLEQFEIEDPADGVLFPTGHVDLQHVIMSVQISAFPLVTDQTVARTEGEAAHDAE